MTTKIRQDRHGLYVRAGGHVFRPVVTAHAYPLAPRADVRNDGTSRFEAGGTVKARHMAQSPFGVITPRRGASEYWHSHGSYLTGTGGIGPSELCWTPKE